ncbi:MAG TPA: dihydrodipicolinate synthase family protein [Clostridia bacterium]
MLEYKGLFPAVVTPYDENGNINPQALERLIDKLINAKVSGLFITGTTGEVFLLSQEERKEIIKTAVKANRGRIKIIAQISVLNTKDSVAMARFAQDCGVDAISVLPPLYFRYRPQQVIDFYKDIAKSVDIPVFAYDIPANTQIEVMDEAYEDIFSIKNVVGIKASHKNLNLIKAFKQKYPEQIVHIGCDELLTAALECGADGAVGSTYNILPEEFLSIIHYFNTGEKELAEKIQTLCNDFIMTLSACGGTPAVKYILKLQGIDCGESRKPFSSLTDSDKERLKAAYADFKKKYSELFKTVAVI